MVRLACIAAMLVFTSACELGAPGGSVAVKSPATVSPTPTPDPPAARCTKGSSALQLKETPPSRPATNLVLIGAGGRYSAQLMYDVTDPVRPRLWCRIVNTSAHLWSGDHFTYLLPLNRQPVTMGIDHWFAEGNVSPGGDLPGSTADVAWISGADRPRAFTTTLMEPSPTSAGVVQVWVLDPATDSFWAPFTYRTGIGSCLCRFGVPAPVLALSPDGGYLVAGWEAGKGSDLLAVYRLSDRKRVATLDARVISAFWDRTGTRLFLTRSGTDPAQVWTLEAGVADLTGAAAWSFLPGQSPNGVTIAYTSYDDPKRGGQPRVYAYDIKTATSRMLVDKMRTQAVFVRNDWVWYLEEGACTDRCPGGTKPTGKVFAMQLSTGTETEVIFPYEENPYAPGISFAPGEFWPAG